MWKARKKEGMIERNRLERRKARVVKKKLRETRRKRLLLLKEGVSNLFPVKLLRNPVTERTRIVVGLLGMAFWVTPVACLIVCLRCRRVCLL